MRAKQYDFVVEQGSTHRFSVEIVDEDDIPFDLTGWEGRGQIRYRATDSNILGEFIIEIDDDPTSGIVFIELPADELIDVRLRGRKFDEKTEAVYDIELFDTVGTDVMRILNGTISISPEVTK